jgi:hypothetical protein
VSPLEHAGGMSRRSAARRVFGLALAAALAVGACGEAGPGTAGASPGGVTASPAGVTAEQFMTTYEQRLAAAEWAAAWDMVSAEQQKAWGSLESYTMNEKAFLELYGPAFVVHPPVAHPDEVRAAASEAGFTSPDLERAALVTVDRVPVRDNSAWEMFLVGTQGNEPRIWQIR